MNVLNPFVRQFLVGWITVLDSVPEIDMLGFLPDFLDGTHLLRLLSCARLPGSYLDSEDCSVISLIHMLLICM